MSHEIIYNSGEKIIEVKTQGNITADDMTTTLSEAFQALKDNNCTLLLADFRESSMHLSTLEIYALPKIIADIATSLGINVYKIKRAVVTSSDSDDLRFKENVTVNQGQHLRIFQNIDQARKWLLE